MSDDETGPNAGETEQRPLPASVPRILLLEDSPGEAELFCRALLCSWEREPSTPGRTGPVIDVQHTAQNALDVLNRSLAFDPGWLPHLIVLDFDLPGGDGLKFLQELHRYSRLATIPVFAMVWFDDESTIRALDSLGVRSYVVKPMFFEDLIILAGNVVRQALSQTSHPELCGLGRERDS
jgi:DNA-binding response OmpR family regulator